MEGELPIGFFYNLRKFVKFFLWSIGWTDLWKKAGEDITSDKKDTN